MWIIKRCWHSKYILLLKYNTSFAQNRMNLIWVGTELFFLQCPFCSIHIFFIKTLVLPWLFKTESFKLFCMKLIGWIFSGGFLPKLLPLRLKSSRYSEHLNDFLFIVNLHEHECYITWKGKEVQTPLGLAYVEYEHKPHKMWK